MLMKSQKIRKNLAKNGQSSQNPTSKSAKIAPKYGSNKPMPTRMASKPKVEKLLCDTPLPPELAKEFQEWINGFKVISEYSFER